jgi:hypothetical protein
MMPKLNRQCQNKLCGCEEPGLFNCGIPGILAGQPRSKGHRYIERCDICERFSSDEAAGEAYADVMGGHCTHDRQRKVIWIPACSRTLTVSIC